jgi:hypothetical protein
LRFSDAFGPEEDGLRIPFNSWNVELSVGNSGNKNSSGTKLSLELNPPLPLDEEVAVAWYGDEGVNGVAPFVVEDGKIPTQLDSLFSLTIQGKVEVMRGEQKERNR